MFYFIGGPSAYRYEEKKYMRRKAINDNTELNESERMKLFRELDEIEEREQNG